MPWRSEGASVLSPLTPLPGPSSTLIFFGHNAHPDRSYSFVSLEGQPANCEAGMMRSVLKWGKLVFVVWIVLRVNSRGAAQIRESF